MRYFCILDSIYLIKNRLALNTSNFSVRLSRIKQFLKIGSEDRVVYDKKGNEPFVADNYK